MPLFDAYLFVDWSARQGILPARPQADSPWIGERLRGSGSQRESYHRTRQLACVYLHRRLLVHLRAGRRVLVGFDFALGYPVGLARALGWTYPEPPWRAIWSQLAIRIHELPGNRSNRFDVARQLNELCEGDCPGPFWARPESAADLGIPARSPEFPYHSRRGLALERRRTTERYFPGTQETWKLTGIGAVGSQTLLGIPLVQRLRHAPEFADVCRIFPFETGFTAKPTAATGPAIICTETYFGGVADSTARALRRNPGLVRDQAQVRAQCRRVDLLDQADRLEEWFTEPVDLSPAQKTAVLQEEGWILGPR